MSKTVKLVFLASLVLNVLLVGVLLGRLPRDVGFRSATKDGAGAQGSARTHANALCGKNLNRCARLAIRYGIKYAWSERKPSVY